jgi:predicted glycogen debranching enzyme
MSQSLPRISLDAEILQNIDDTLRFEWLITNGLGGYASSTPLGVNTRKYHGLLVAALNPPVNRHVILSKFDEEIQIGNKTYKLGINEFRDTFYPKPQGLLQGFSLNPFPIFKYETQEIALQKTIFMPRSKNATIVTYDVHNASDSSATVRIFPLINFRHFYYTTHKAQLNWKLTQKPQEKTSTFQFVPSQYVLLLAANKGKYLARQGVWIENVYLRVDASKKEDYLDDCFLPGNFEFQVGPKKQEQFSITAIADQTEEEANSLVKELTEEDSYSQGLKSRTDLLTTFRKRYADTEMNDLLKWLVLATDMFVVNRASTKGKSVIAGYHWFEDWGRDTLISLPGLTLATGRFDDARKILSTFKQYCNKGALPNRFPDREGDKPEYNTVDASLWFFNAIQEYVKYTGDSGFVKNELWDTLQSMIYYYERGTLNNIYMDTDGLIAHDAQLTWMDATINNVPITGRAGKAVEIEALWYNALRTMQQLAKQFNQKNLEQKYVEMAEKAKKSFLEKFWNPQNNCLFDVISHNEKDSSIRPNQILAVSLDFSMLDKVKSEAIMNIIQNTLWCEYGLRTLSPDDPHYIGKYVGDWAQRNRAYHNGTVWPWLLGPFITAFLKVKKHESQWREFAFQKFLLPFFQKTIHHDGLGAISEIYDGDEPHLPRGCIAQAWSVAEPLRAFVEDVTLKHPLFEGKVDL